MSLEEAEKKMNSRGTVSRLAAGSKLGALAAKGIPPPPPKRLAYPHREIGSPIEQ